MAPRFSSPDDAQSSPRPASSLQLARSSPDNARRRSLSEDLIDLRRFSHVLCAGSSTSPDLHRPTARTSHLRRLIRIRRLEVVLLTWRSSSAPKTTTSPGEVERRRLVFTVHRPVVHRLILCSATAWSSAPARWSSSGSTPPASPPPGAASWVSSSTRLPLSILHWYCGSGIALSYCSVVLLCSATDDWYCSLC